MLRSKLNKMAPMLDQLVGRTGRGYNVLRPLKPEQEARSNIRLAEYAGKKYVLKSLSIGIFEQAQRVGRDLQGCRFVRLPEDIIPSDCTVVYEHMTDDLLSVMQRQALSLEQRKHILRSVLQALGEMHSRDFVHTDVKPDNVLINYLINTDSRLDITAVKLADIDNAVHLRKEQAVYATVGNVHWRSPEAQLRVGISKPTDVFSFGLVCIHVMLSINIFGFTPEDLQPGVDKEPQVVDRMIRYFGLVPDALFQEKITDQWRQILKILNDSYDTEDCFELFSEWGEKVFPSLATDPQFKYLDSDFKRFIGRMTNMNQDERATVLELLDDPWWKGVDT